MGTRLAAATLGLLGVALIGRGAPVEAAQGASRPGTRSTLAAAAGREIAQPARPLPSAAERISQRLGELEAMPPSAVAGPSAALAAAVAEARAGLGPAAQLGVHVRELGSNTTLLDDGGELALNPASNHKLLTAIAALELLGPAYRFETRVALDGDALVLQGSGDPSLQTEDLQRLAEAVAAQIDLGVVRRIVVDDGMFSDERFGPGYDPGGPGFSYLAPSGALSLQWNTVEVTLAAHHGAVEVFVDPPCAHVVVENHARIGRGEPDVTTQADGGHTRVRVDGQLRRGSVRTIRRRVTDPGRFAAAVFAAALGRPELPIARGRLEADALPLGEHHSPPLAEVLHSALKFSNNVTTEQLLRTLGHLASGRPGDWHNGTAVLRTFWAALGRDPAEIVFENASGYSSVGRVSARTLADLLAWSQRPGSRSGAVAAAMAVAGVDGTLRDRLREAPGRVFAKTGTLSGANALSGLVADEGGTPRLAFSVLLNGPVTGHTAHALQDRLVRALLPHAVASR